MSAQASGNFATRVDLSSSANVHDWSNLAGRLIVVSGPSGSGKTSLVRKLVARPDSPARLSVSATTRPPRPGEENGREYYFLTRADFESKRDRGDFLEWAEVHGNLYGTPAEPVRQVLSLGLCVILEIDVQGALQIVERVPSTVLVFVNTPTFEILEERLRSRSTEDEATIQIRLSNARREIDLSSKYHHQLVNEDLDRAVDALADLLAQLGCERTTRDA